MEFLILWFYLNNLYRSCITLVGVNVDVMAVLRANFLPRDAML